MDLAQQIVVAMEKVDRRTLSSLVSALGAVAARMEVEDTLSSLGDALVAVLGHHDFAQPLAFHEGPDEKGLFQAVFYQQDAEAPAGRRLHSAFTVARGSEATSCSPLLLRSAQPAGR